MLIYSVCIFSFSCMYHWKTHKASWNTIRQFSPFQQFDWELIYDLCLNQDCLLPPGDICRHVQGGDICRQTAASLSQLSQVPHLAVHSSKWFGNLPVSTLILKSGSSSKGRSQSVNFCGKICFTNGKSAQAEMCMSAKTNL